MSIVSRDHGRLNSMWSWTLLTSLLLLLLSASIVDVDAQDDVDYCGELGWNNTMCQYPGPSTTCDFVEGAPTITDSTIDEILSVHNNLRAQVANGNQDGQPPASNMRELVWDAGLAVVAQRWADQCTFEHDTNRVTPRFPTWVGQNIGEKSSWPHAKPMNFTWVINDWYNEVDYYTPGPDNVLVFSKATGHYTQVVSAVTYAVGCGYSQFRSERKRDRIFYTNFYVCNYGPGGNNEGEPLYLVGEACSACDDGVSCSNRYPGLCVTPSK